MFTIRIRSYMYRAYIVKLVSDCVHNRELRAWGLLIYVLEGCRWQTLWAKMNLLFIYAHLIHEPMGSLPWTN